MNINNIRGFGELPESKKDRCIDFIQSIISSEFPGENVEIKRVREYCDGVEVTFCKNDEEYTFCNVTPKFFQEMNQEMNDNV